MQIVGEKIKQARKELGMTQDTLADSLKRLGVKVQKEYISHWENGKGQPSQPGYIAEKLAIIFKKKKAFFLVDEVLVKPENKEGG